MEVAAKNKTKTISKYRNPNREERKILYFDYTLLIILVIILAFGLVMLYSVSSYMGGLKSKDPAYYLKKQAMAAALGFVLMFVMAKIDYRKLKKFNHILYWISFILCAMVLVIGTSKNNSSRWLSIGKLSIQPSEIAKISIIIYVAALVADKGQFLNKNKNIFKSFMYLLPIIAVVGLTNLSTAIIIAGIAFFMLWIASRKNTVFGIIILIGFAAVLIFIFGGWRSDRIKIWRNPEKYDKGLQTLQGLYAIGSGGLFGKGLGNSMQKTIVPEASNDMIFSIICEELGIIGAIGLIILYILLLWRCLVIAQNANDTFGSFIAIGVFCHIALQVILNIAVVTNTIPNTGITLPFISYGGSALVISLLEMGLVLSVSHGITIGSL